MRTFGAPAPLKKMQKKFGFEPDRVVAVAKEVLGRKENKKPASHRAVGETVG